MSVLIELARITKLIYPSSDVDFPDLLLKKPTNEPINGEAVTKTEFV